MQTVCAKEPYKVSIGVPVFGVEKYIERCARSLFEQTYNNLEYVFVNDCTKDSSIAILKKVLEDYPERQKQVKILNHEKNQGLGGARNTAVSNASGSFLLWVDADDYVDVQLIKKVVDKQIENDADIVSFDYFEDYGDNNIKKIRSNYLKETELWKKDVVSRVEPTMVWRRLFRISLYRENLIEVKLGVNMGEDYQVVPKLFYYAQRIDGLNDCLYYYNKANISSYCASYNISKAEQSIQSAFIVKQFFRNKGYVLKNAADIALAKTIAMQVRGCINASKREYYKKLKRRMNSFSRAIIEQLPIRDRLMFSVKNYTIWRLVCILFRR